MDTAVSSQENPFPLDPERLADLIDIPLGEWPGNCHGVASAILGLVPVEGMRLVRGHWHGHVARSSVYRSSPCQHSWLELEDGRILDPTRWAFTRPKSPYIYLGVNDEYDEAGRMMSQRIPPMLPGRRDGLVDTIAGLDAPAREKLVRALERERGSPAASITDGRIAEELRWQLRSDPRQYRDPEFFFRALEETGLRALVPVDCWQAVMEPGINSVRKNANRYFQVPPREAMTDARILVSLMSRFVSIEERGNLEAEVGMFGYSLEEYWDALNRIERLSGLDIEHLPREEMNIISLMAGDYLGQGHGEVLRVERYAWSLGLKKSDLDRLLRRVGDRSGYTLWWE